MNCQEFSTFLSAYCDGELDLAGSLEFEKHLQSCPHCRRAYENQSVVKKAVTANAPYYRAPADLRRNILAAIRSDSGAEHDAPKPSIVRPKPWAWQWSPVSAGLAMAACLAIGFFGALGVTQHSSRNLLAREIAASHVRSLLATHLMDVVSTDQHTVKPWFDGKLDFAPPVTDLAADGYPLIGGRLDYIGGRTVAVLVYQRRKHYINLFVWPGSSESASRQTATESGYNLLNWGRNGMTFWEVSDINKEDLQAFADLFESRTAPASR